MNNPNSYWRSITQNWKILTVFIKVFNQILIKMKNKKYNQG